jgi:RNA 2',3'-cyclic 3'-phosphodiesterase
LTSPATVEGRDRLRLFCALRLPEETISDLVAWQGLELAGRIVPPDNLHVTLAFLGARRAGELGPIAHELREAAAAAQRPVLRPRGYRETRSVGMLVFDDEEGRATSLAEDVHGRLERRGVYRREQRPWLPHVTVLRFRERPRLHPSLPELGAVVPSEAAVYHSLLRPTGAQYEVLESVALGGR